MPTSVLLIDDNPGHLDLIEGFLSTKDFAIRRETDGQAALKSLGKPPYPDLVMLDYMMPMTPGATVYERIRQNPDLKELPVIVLSAINQSTVKEKIPPCAATQFVTKPVDFRILDAAMRSLLGGKYPQK